MTVKIKCENGRILKVTTMLLPSEAKIGEIATGKSRINSMSYTGVVVEIV